MVDIDGLPQNARALLGPPGIRAHSGGPGDRGRRAPGAAALAGGSHGRCIMTASRAVSWVPARSGNGAGNGSGDRSSEARERRAPVGKGSKR